MRISYVRIENFRNFQLVEVELGQNIILVGENKAGKSNFIEALRLILDPSLSDLDRYLTAHDFWDGVEPFKNNQIKITVRLTDYANDPHPDFLPISLLNGSCIVETVPQPVAQLTYIYENVKNLDTPENSGLDDYDFKIYPGNNPNASFNIRELRKYMPLEVIKALRDIASDSRAWRRSPLGRLLELIDLELDQLEPFATEVKRVSEEVLGLNPLSVLQSDIQDRLKQMIGELYTVIPRLGLNATTSKSLLQDLRLFVDGDKQRTLDRTSLGLQNVLYLTLLTLRLEKQEMKSSRSRTRYIPFVALEEPEAHLHPHLQRLVFNDFLENAWQRKQPVIVSTHSPYLASTAKTEDLVLARENKNSSYELRSSYSFITALDPRDQKDIDRFLDITRSEMLFSKGVVFVEGDVEVLLMPEFAKIMNTPLDEYGITVCNVYGTKFALLVTLAHKFGIPFLVLTDGDNEQTYSGIQRGIDILRTIIQPSLHSKLQSKYDNQEIELVRRFLRIHGVFVNNWTFEPTLIEVGFAQEFKLVFQELGQEIGVTVRGGVDYVDEYLADPTIENMKKIIRVIDDSRWGKGRFAHRLIRHIHTKANGCADQESRNSLIPEYIRMGIQYLATKVQEKRI